MPRAQGLSRTTPRYRALKSVRGARSELCRLYHAVRDGEIDPVIGGRLCQILVALLASAKAHQFEERLDGLEARLTGIKPNGSTSHEARP
jgi:hypothetical protein